MLGLAAALLIVQAPAVGEEWWFLRLGGEIGEQDAFYADRASIRRTGDRVRIVLAREAERPDDVLQIASTRRAVEFDCRTRTWLTFRVDAILADGSVERGVEGPDEPRPVPPGGPSEDALRFACGDSAGSEQVGRSALRENALQRFAARARTAR